MSNKIGAQNIKGIEITGRNPVSFSKLKSAAKSDDKKKPFAYLSITLEAPVTDPLLFAQHLLEKDKKVSAYWQQPQKKYAFITGGILKTLNPLQDNHFKSYSQLLHNTCVEDISSYSSSSDFSIPFWIGGLQFDAGNPDNSMLNQPSKFFIPEWIYVVEETRAEIRFYLNNYEGISGKEVSEYLQNRINFLFNALDQLKNKTLSAESRSAGNPFTSQTTITRHWQKSVKHIKKLIADREIKKLVLARSIKLPVNTEVNVIRVLDYLRQYYPGCTNLMIDMDNGIRFLASTPEHLLSVQNHKIFTESLAGSSSRGSELVADEQNRHQLLESNKNLNEHCIVRDDILCQLEQFVSELDFPRKPNVKQLANVQHLCTPIHGTLKNGSDVFTLLSHLHPTPAVGGYPRYNIPAMIKKLEDFDRGWYASPIGWIDSHGNADFVVGLRSGNFTDTCIRLFAGCGIVSESDPALEWEETNLKFMPLLNALRHI